MKLCIAFFIATEWIFLESISKDLNMIPDNNILDTIISLTLIYALLSILVSVLLEWWNHRKKARAKFLKQAVFQLLDDPLNVNFGEIFYNHFLVDGLKFREGKRPPQYISSSLFAEVLIDILANRRLHHQPIEMTGFSDDAGKEFRLQDEAKEDDVMKRFALALEELNPSPLTDTLRSLWQKSDSKYEVLKQLLSNWFDDYMDRVSGWYKTKQRTKLMVFGFGVAIVLNVDSLHLLKVISMDDTLRGRLIAQAEKAAAEYEQQGSAQSTNVASLTNEQLIHKADSILAISNELDLPIGWNDNQAPWSWIKPKPETKALTSNGLLMYFDKRNRGEPWFVFLYFVGIAISGFSLSFGAPFWFETLVKLINIRRAGKKPEAVNTR